MTQATVKIHVQMLDECLPTLMGTDAIPLGSDIYQLLPNENYSVEDDSWEFLPGAIVRAEMRPYRIGEVLLIAVEQLEPPPYTSEIYVRWIASKDANFKPRQAISLGKHVYKLLPDQSAPAADGAWEFPDGAILQCEYAYPNFGFEGLAAVEQAG